MLAWIVLHRIVYPVCMACDWFFFICRNCHILIGVYHTITKPCSVLFQVGTIAEITSPVLQKTQRNRNTSGTATSGCMFVATTSGDVGRCTVQPELFSNDSTRCVPDKEAGDEEHSTAIRQPRLNCPQTLSL